MSDEFILVHKSIVPKYYELVLSAKEKIEGANESVSDVCKKLGISRSTYYKYKDFVFYPSKTNTKKAILSFKVIDAQGVLGNIINIISSSSCNVLTISQDMPIHNAAFITMMIDYRNLNCSMNQLLGKLKNIEQVKSVEVVSYE
jgi:chorismate mutase